MGEEEEERREGDAAPDLTLEEMRLDRGGTVCTWSNYVQEWVLIMRTVIH